MTGARGCMKVVTALVVAACVLGQGGHSAAEAQARRVERPYRAVFGSDLPALQRGQRLLTRMSLFGSYDDNVVGDQAPSPALLATQTGGYYSGATVGLEYERRGRRFSLGSDLGSSFRYYPRLQDLNGASPYVSLSLNATMGSVTLAASQRLEYTPYYSLSFTPAIPTGIVPGEEIHSGGLSGGGDGNRVALDQRKAYGFNTSVGLTQKFNQRNSLAAVYWLHRRDFTSLSQADLSTQRGSLTYRHQVTRYAALRLGYGLEQGKYQGGRAAAPDTRMHLLDIGADYRRPLSFSRRTLLDVKFGSTAIEGGLVAGRVYRVIGDAGLTHEIGRTWQLAGVYHRGAGLVEGLAQPVFSDAVHARLGGFANRRTEVTLESGYTEGEVGVTGYRNPFTSLNASARVQWALTSKLALFTDYLYYRYKFDGSYALPSGLSPNFNRQGVRVGLTTLLPLIK